MLIIAAREECGFDSYGMQIKAGDGSEKVGCKMFIPASAMICPHEKCGFVYPKDKREGRRVKLHCHDTDIGEAPIVLTAKMGVEEFVKYCQKNGYDAIRIWRELFFRGGIDEVLLAADIFKWRKHNVDAAKRYCSRFKN